LGVNFTFAQLSDRVNSPSTFKIGTRPVAGNWCLVFAPSYQDIKDLKSRIDGNDSTEVKNSLPVIALRMYSSDNNVWRIGLRSMQKNLLFSGNLDPSLAANGGISEYKFQRKQSEFYITPGIEHHFAKSNILDIYVGACIPLGYKKDNNTDYMKSTSDYDSYEKSRFALAYGFEGFFGVQAFVADLPLSIGLELGTTALGVVGKKWKVAHSSSVGGTVTNQTYYQVYKDDSDALTAADQIIYNNVLTPLQFSKLKAKSFTTDGMARLTISYYFNK
jgi:hypothetical protein